VGLCLLLTLLVTGTYVLNVRDHILTSILNLERSFILVSIFRHHSP